MLVWEEFYISVGKIGWMNAFLSADLIAAECKTVDLSIPKTSQNCWKEAILTKEVVCLKKKRGWFSSWQRHWGQLNGKVLTDGETPALTRGVHRALGPQRKDNYKTSSRGLQSAWFRSRCPSRSSVRPACDPLSPHKGNVCVTAALLF